MRIRNWGLEARRLGCASSLSLAFGCSLQDFDTLGAGIGLGGAGGDEVEPGGGGNGGSGSNGGSGGNGGNGGNGAEGGTAGTEAGQGGSAGVGGSGSGGNGGSTTDPGELMTDPGFETTLSGWSPFGGGTALLTRVQDQARGGTSSLLSSNRTAAYMGAGLDLRPLTSTEESYTLTAWVRLAEADGADAGPPLSATLSLTLKAKCNEETDTTAAYAEIGTADVFTDRWTLITGTTLPFRSDCETLLDYRIYIAQPAAAAAPYPEFYVDDVSFTQS